MFKAKEIYGQEFVQLLKKLEESFSATPLIKTNGENITISDVIQTVSNAKYSDMVKGAAIASLTKEIRLLVHDRHISLTEQQKELLHQITTRNAKHEAARPGVRIFG